MDRPDLPNAVIDCQWDRLPVGHSDRLPMGQIANGTDWKTLLVWSASGGQMQFLKAFSFLEGLVSGE